MPSPIGSVAPPLTAAAARAAEQKVISPAQLERMSDGAVTRFDFEVARAAVKRAAGKPEEAAAQALLEAVKGQLREQGPVGTRAEEAKEVAAAVRDTFSNPIDAARSVMGLLSKKLGGT